MDFRIKMFTELLVSPARIEDFGCSVKVPRYFQLGELEFLDLHHGLRV